MVGTREIARRAIVCPHCYSDKVNMVRISSWTDDGAVGSWHQGINMTIDMICNKCDMDFHFQIKCIDNGVDANIFVVEDGD